ncbi:hypothetical protein D3C75_1076100 [compost metagenome]
MPKSLRVQLRLNINAKSMQRAETLFHGQYFIGLGRDHRTEYLAQCVFFPQRFQPGVQQGNLLDDVLLFFGMMCGISFNDDPGQHLFTFFRFETVKHPKMVGE